MKIYNQEKTRELSENEVDYTLGKTIADKLFVAHHEAVAEVPTKLVEQVVAELQAQGIEAEQAANGKWYKTVHAYESGGKDVEEVKAVEGIPAKEAWDEYEDIQVFVPYTAEELRERKLNELRNRREQGCYPIINRGQLWYDMLTDEQKAELKAWYRAWLDVTETEVIPTKPEWLK